MNVEYDEKADCPMWEEFIETITRDAVGDDRPDVTEYLQTLLGYALYGEFEEKVFPVCYGSPDTGKSTFFEVLAYVFGTYHTAADVTAFDMRRYASSGHTDSIAVLRGARLITATEPKEFFKLNSSLIKRITGNDTFQASHKHEQTFNMKIVGLMMLATNHRMLISATDDAVWIRVKEIPFENVIPKEEQIKGYAEELKQEGSGILNWLITGWHNYRAIKGKIEPPLIVIENTKEYQRSQDKVESFLEECCELGDTEAKMKSGELHRIYNVLLRQNGFRAESNRAFTFAMERKGQLKFRDNKAVWWQGVKPNDEWRAV
jgi:putative DNA primase/helicase